VDCKRLTTKDGQQDVDEEVSTTTALEEDSERRQHDGADDLDDVAVVALAWCYKWCCGGCR